MKNIVIFNNYNRKKGDLMKEKLIQELTNKNRNGYKYSLNDIREITNKILNISNFYSGRCATPIVKIAKTFNFKTYKESLNKSGDIHINGETSRKYGHNQVILVNKKVELFHQRFVVAHEFAHYLFDFLGNKKYDNKNILFYDTYQKDKHDTPQEKRANTFAAEIMMPRDLFVTQYNIARHEENNHMFIVMYLSRYFETSVESIEKRIKEVSK